MDEVIIRRATICDISEIQLLYTFFVQNTSATFEIEPPNIEEMEKRFYSIQNNNYPYLVAECNNKIIGFAFVKMYYGRDGFFPTVENSIYIHKNNGNKKIGSKLLSQLIYECKDIGIKNIIAYIGGGTKNVTSIKLHEKFGFKQIGIYKKIGFKLDEYQDMAAYQLEIK